MKVVYIAGPFRARNPNGTNDAWRTQQHIMRAMEYAAFVWRAGHAAICPHANTMFFQDLGGAPDTVWLEGDLELLRRSDAMFLVPGWERSQGATAERQYAVDHAIPIFEDPDRLADWFTEVSR